MTSREVAPTGVILLAENLGRGLLSFLAHLGSLARLGAECIRQGVRLRPSQLGVIYEATRNQIRFTAIEALPLVLLTAILLGGVSLLQVIEQLSAWAAESTLSSLMARLVVRELGPLLVAILVVGRSATAIAAEMATLKLDHEVDTLYATGVDPLSYLLVPRLVGGMISLFSLLVVFDVVALFGGFVVASFRLPLSFHLYVTALGEAIGPAELAGTLGKALAFGAAIPLVSCHAGLALRASSTEIPQAVTRAAVESMAAIFLLSAAISLACYG